MPDKNEEQILVVPSDIIFQQGKWQGLKTDNLDYYIDLIKKNAQFKRRGDMENDSSWQQIIPYILFSYKDDFFAYKYLSAAGEQRLVNNNYQLGVGGHINKDDIDNGDDILEAGMMREWEEEVHFKGHLLEKKLVGIIKDETSSVEKVHIGLVYHFVGDSPNIFVEETDKMEGKLMTLNELTSSVSHSPWMQIVYENYLAKPNPDQQKLFSAKKSGKFIVVEGLDGSGKSAQVDLIVEYLKQKGADVVVTKEPTIESEAGRKIKQALKKEIFVEPLELQKLYVQDRKEHLENKVIPALEQGKFVVSSRYMFSTFAYGYSDGLNVNELVKMNENFLVPDLTLVVDVSPESCVKRIEGRGEPKELFEQLEKLKKVNEIYRKIPAMFENVELVDGEKSISEVFENIKKIINKKFFKNNMKILQNEGSYKILAIMMGLQGETPLELIETAGRTAYQSRDKVNGESALKFAKALRNRGHESVFEHSCMTVEFNNVSRGLTHELVRHRLAAYTQESTRYVDEKDFRVVAPPNKDVSEKIVELNLPGSENPGLKISLKVSFEDWMNLNEQMYKGLRQAGWVPQDARQILPTAIESQIVVTANLREWRHIFKMRCAIDAHWEIRDVMVKLLKDVQQKIPVLFDDFQISADGLSAILVKPQLN